MQPHNELVAAWQETLGAKGEIRLLARLHDPLLGNGSGKEFYLFVPDLHLLSDAAKARFPKYSFNHQDSELLARLLESAHEVRRGWKDTGGPTLVTVQLGDFFDVWREFTGRPDLNRISDAHTRLRDILYRGQFRRKACLKATMLLGNHDTLEGEWMSEVPFQLKMHNWTANDRPFLFATHGDLFDFVERVVPEGLKAFFVRLFGSSTPVNEYNVGTWGRAAQRGNRKASEMERAIVREEHELSVDGADGAPVVHVDPSSGRASPLPRRLLEVVTRHDRSSHASFSDFYTHVRDAARKSAAVASLRAIVMGHSHHARMSLCEPPSGRPLLLMDVGAWIERCKYRAAGLDEPVVEPNAQLGVIHGNDARIYQFRPTT